MNGTDRRFLLPVCILALACCAMPLAAQDAQMRRGFSVTITEPANQEVIFGKTRIVADVRIEDARDLERVEFLVGDEVIFVDREAPYLCFHDFGTESKPWIIRAIAYHREGLTVSDAVISRKMTFGTFEEVNRVILWVSVTDKQDQFVTELDRDEFRVMENGEEQRIIDFYPEDRPITMAILLDTSGSMQEKIEEVHEAAESFVETLRPQDRALVIDFDERVFLIQDLTSDHGELKEAVTSTEPIGGTSMYDALHAAYRKMKGIKGRKAVVLLSDGEDTSSQFGYQRVLEEAKANNIMIFAIGVGTGLGKGALREFADVTGGRPYFVNKAKDLAGVYQRIAEELRKQYYLTYSTGIEEWDGKWIKLKVESTRPGHKVRARRGFFAVKQDG